MASPKVKENATPDFTKMTLEQAKALAGSNFSSVSPQGPADWVVVRQIPTAGKTFYLGKTPLTLYLEPPQPAPLPVPQPPPQSPPSQPSVWTQFIQGLIKNAGPVAKKPGTGDQVATNNQGAVAKKGADPNKVAATDQNGNIDQGLVQKQSDRTVVPRFTKDSCETAKAVGEKWRLQVACSGAPDGLVVRQSKQAGISVPVNSEVEVTLQSEGPPPTVPEVVVVPDLKGMSLDEARSTLDGVGLLVGTEGNVAGTISGQSPEAGMQVDPETSVEIALAVATPWGWIATAGVVTILGIALGPRIWRILFPDPVVTTAAHANSGGARITSRVLPGIAFAVSLRDRPADGAYRFAREPEIVERGGIQ
jgi:beta-lactam-binding protein with PASTA domain